MVKIIFLILLITSTAFAQTMIKGPALIEGVTSTATAAGTTTLTKDSQTVQVFTGTTTQTVTLPDATTLPVGRYFEFYNLSTGAVAVNANGDTLQRTLAASDHAKITLTDKSTAAGTWAVEKITIDLSDSLLTGTLSIAKGGTGQTSANAAFNALAPSQATNSGKYLTTDGTDTSWSDIPSGATSQGQSEAIAVSTTNFKAPYDQVTTTGTDERLIESGNENLLVNPNFEHSTATTSWTVGLGSSAAVETTEVKSGKKSLAVTVTGLTGFSVYQDVTPTIKTEGSNLEHGIWVKTALTTLTVCARNAEATVGTCATVSGDNKWHYYSVLMAGPTSGSVGVSVVTTSSTTGTYYIDAAYVGLARNIGAGVPNNTFSAKVSATGVVSDENEDFINGNLTITSNTLFSGSFISGKFNVAPTCVITLNLPGGAINTNYGRVYNITTSAFNAETANTNTTTAAPFNLICTRAGTDFIQPTITANNRNYGPRSYTPTISGLGSGSATLNRATISRTGAYATVCVDYTKDATAGTGGTSVTVSLPSGIGINSAYGNRSWIGNGTSTIGTNNIAVVGSVSSNELAFFSGTATLTGAGFTANSYVNGCVTFPATENGVAWTENQNAPQLVGSVTSNATSAVRTESARIYGGGTNSACITSPCSVGQIVSWISSTTRSGTGAYVVNHTLGAAPYCTLTGGLSPASARINPIIVSVSSTVINVEGSDDTSFYLHCDVSR